MSDDDAVTPPTLPRRLAALVYDTLLVLPLIMASVALSMGIRTLVVGNATGNLETAELHPQLVQLIAGVAVALFFSWFWIRNGQTLGMQAWRIKLVSIDGQPLSGRQTLIRCLGAALSAACLGMGYWWCLIDSRRRYWHDYLSRTELILVPKAESKKAKRRKQAEVTGPANR